MIQERLRRCISEIISPLYFHRFQKIPGDNSEIHLRIYQMSYGDVSSDHILFKMRWSILVVIWMRPKMHLRTHNGKFWIFKDMNSLIDSLIPSSRNLVDYASISCPTCQFHIQNLTRTFWWCSLASLFLSLHPLLLFNLSTISDLWFMTKGFSSFTMINRFLTLCIFNNSFLGCKSIRW